MPSVVPQSITELHPIELRPLPAQPLVSILVSNYNYGRFIADSIKSALDQTYSNFELIICDDGSTDDSVHIVEEYGVQRFAPALDSQGQWRPGIRLQCGLCRLPGRDHCLA